MDKILSISIHLQYHEGQFGVVVKASDKKLADGPTLCMKSAGCLGPVTLSQS